jgi:autotransporter adhesin
MIVHQDSQWRDVDGFFAKLGHIDISLYTVRELATGTPGNIAANGGLLASDTTPILAAVNGDTNGRQRVHWAASNSDAIGFQITLPKDIDCHQPVYVKFLANMAGATDTPVISADSYFDNGTKVEDDSGAVTGTGEGEYTITIAAADVPHNARSLSVELTPGAHTTDALYVYGLWVEYTRL